VVEPLVVAEMKGAMTLTVPLEVSVSQGATWAECE
jgi:DNA polymerase I-like protein with 3'-5' exonuclease and polymerase domains